MIPFPAGHMNTRHTQPSARLAPLAGVVLGLTAWLGTARAAEDWHVPQATVRFAADVLSQPSEPSAGLLASVPDGGFLPRDAEPVVVTAAGAMLKSACAWRNPREGLGVVFEPQPNGQRVWIYVQPGSPSPSSAGFGSFTPGLLLYTRSGVASLEEARQLSKLWPLGANAIMGQVDTIGHRENPFGADDEYVSYYIGWLKPAAPGRTYLCTVSDDGSEC